MEDNTPVNFTKENFTWDGGIITDIPEKPINVVLEDDMLVVLPIEESMEMTRALIDAGYLGVGRYGNGLLLAKMRGRDEVQG